MLAGSGRLKWVHDALFAEGEACLEALKAAMEVGISRVAIETDSVNLVAAVTSDRFDQALGGVLFREIRVLLSLHFVTLSFSHVSRTCNGCAHELACSGLQRDPDQPVIWSDPLPSFVKNLVVRDLIDQVNKENKLESQKKNLLAWPTSVRPSVLHRPHHFPILFQHFE